MLLLFVDVGVSQKMTEKNKEIHSHKKMFCEIKKKKPKEKQDAVSLICGYFTNRKVFEKNAQSLSAFFSLSPSFFFLCQTTFYHSFLIKHFFPLPQSLFRNFIVITNIHVITFMLFQCVSFNPYRKSLTFLFCHNFLVF